MRTLAFPRKSTLISQSILTLFCLKLQLQCLYQKLYRLSAYDIFLTINTQYSVYLIDNHMFKCV
jgi:hypothetical protein